MTSIMKFSELPALNAPLLDGTFAAPVAQPVEPPTCTVGEDGYGQENHCPDCGAVPGQMCSSNEGVEWGRRVHVSRQQAQPAKPVELTEIIEALCARIKAADDAAADRDYMLDSDDCIAVIRGTWKAPLMNDKPAKQAAAKGKS